MPTKTINAVILSRKNYGEADRLLSAFSLEEGKIRILAKGSRKIKSKMAGHIEPFSFGEYFVAIGKNFYILAGAEKTFFPQKVSNDMELYKDISYICEITEMLVDEEKTNGLYELLYSSIACLNKISDKKRGIVIRYFEYNLLKLLGYGPELNKCKKCHVDLVESDYYFGDFEGIFCSNCRGDGIRIKKNTVKILRLFETRDISDILNLKRVGDYDEKIKEVIFPFLRDILPRQPKSHEL